MQPEKSFDKLSKRLAVAVSRRSLLRTLSLALTGAFLPWAKVSLAELAKSSQLQPQFRTRPKLINVPIGAAQDQVCVATVFLKDGITVAIGATAAKSGMCPPDIPSYFEKSTRHDDSLAKEAPIEIGRRKETAEFGGYEWLFAAQPLANFYRYKDEYGLEQIEAFCIVAIYAFPKIPPGESGERTLVYKRFPKPEKISSTEDSVGCGSMSIAAQATNLIEQVEPVALRKLEDDVVPHDRSSSRERTSDSPASSDSSHKSK